MQVTSASSSAQQLAIAAAKAEGRSQRLVSAEAFGQTRGADRFEKTLQAQAPQVTYSADVSRQPSTTNLAPSQQTQDSSGQGAPETAEVVQFTQSDVDNLLKLFGSISGDSDFLAEYDLDGSGTIDLADLNAMLAQLGEPQSEEVSTPETFTQSDIDLLMESFGAQTGDEAYSDALDLDGDGIIGLQDLNTMLANLAPVEESQIYTQAHVDQLTAAFGSQFGDDNFVAELDLNGDGTLNLVDLNQLLASLS